ncbi:MAG: hypothetical protein KBC16_03000 [Candidatus Pacebacteria bacterium]|nr:hypothetical protein [Candidatus Paceibacterota bacterium]
MKYFYISLALVVVLFAPQVSFASGDVEVSGWIPYWRASEGSKATVSHITAFSEVSPFGYTVKKDGTLYDAMKLKNSAWKKLFTSARKNHVLILPSVMMSDGAQIHAILSDSTQRAKHIDSIMSEVEKHDFDGIDIDYEGKKASTREYFSTFLKELKAELGDKILVCTIEARTPPESLYSTVPATLEYANDYPSINKYCDRVRIMTYDQQTADIKLNAEAAHPYAPVSDTRWVRKVMEFTKKSIDADKLSLGIPTYGHEYEITVYANGLYGYKKLWAFNPKYATDMAKKKKVTPARSESGEMVVAYLPKKLPKTPEKVTVKAPEDASKAEMAIYEARAYALATGNPTKVNVMWWSDAGAIKDKADLARELGIRGVGIFKIDGGFDKGLWNALK